MTAINQRVKFWCGDTKTVRINLRYKDGTAPTPNAEWRADWWMAPTANSPGTEVLIRKSSEAGEITFSGSHADVVLTPTDTEQIEPGTYYHECQVIDALGRVATTTTGPFILHRSLIPVPASGD